jgi:hypothetical protein
MFELWNLMKNIIYILKYHFKNFSLSLSNNEELVKFFLLFYAFEKSIDHNEL